MAYTTNQAIETLNGYLGINDSEKEIIENTKKRGFVYSLPNGEKAVIFVYPLVHKLDNTKNYFDTRDSGAYERGVAWNYAIENNLKYFCIGVNDTVDKYAEYAFSLECNESDIERISGTINGSRNGPGNQIIIPNDYVPSKPVERIINKLGIYITAVHKDNLINYLAFYDNRPYMENAVLANFNGTLDDAYVERENLFNTDYDSPFSRNRILFGAPGTGKSYTLNHDLISLLGENNESDYERVTFHPDYSYANFVGTYKPVMVEESSDIISQNLESDVLAVLTDGSKTAQEKYDLLYNDFKEAEHLNELSLLLGIYSDDNFRTRNEDGKYATGYNMLEKNYGKTLRPYINIMNPVPNKKSISYEYVPGPFMRVLVKALKNAMTDKPRPFLLLIEEINRANVAAVFGDVFQLLDRDSDGVSEYKIATTNDMRRYLSEKLGIEESKVESIKIPNNMFIWATMNSADQGVFPMDTAFKRRWDFTYLGIDDNDEKLQGKYVLLADDKSQKVEWNKLRKAINNFLANEKINEDKQLGPYFISKDIVIPEGDEINRDKFINAFKNKVIMYLFEDAAKQKRSKLFEGCFQNSSRYSQICKEFEEKGVGIFNKDIIIDCEIEDVETEIIT